MLVAGRWMLLLRAGSRQRIAYDDQMKKQGEQEMSSKVSSASATLVAAKAFNRRTVLKGALYAGSALSVGPFVLPRRALGAGQVNVFA